MAKACILEGDCREMLGMLGSGSVQTCITSPPYLGLRDYGHKGQIGLNGLDEYVADLVDVFREVRRVLRDDGTLWLNLGDSYNSIGHKKSHSGFGTTGLAGGNAQEHHPTGRENSVPGLKHKDLIGVPWRVALALQADGWWLRSDIIWAKPNPMPESVTDRPTKAHEFLFLLSKSARYYYDAEAIREDDSGLPAGNGFVGRQGGSERYGDALADLGSAGTEERWLPGGGRNKRSVWTVTTQPFPGAHFATFPPRLIEPCVLAGSSPQACRECGAPWKRVTEAEIVERTDGGMTRARVDGAEARHRRLGATSVFATNALPHVTTVGWEPSCAHPDGSGRQIVLDPFNGAGTTGLVALRHDRNYVGIELNPEYAQMSRDRIYDDGPLLNEVAA